MGMMTVIKIFLATAGLLVLAFGLGLLWVKEGREDSSLEILMKGIVTAFAAFEIAALGATAANLPYHVLALGYQGNEVYSEHWEKESYRNNGNPVSGICPHCC